MQQFSFNYVRSRRPILDIKATEFLRRFARVHQQGLGVSECPPFGSADEIIHVHTGPSTQCALQFEAFTVITATGIPDKDKYREARATGGLKKFLELRDGPFEGR